MTRNTCILFACIWTLSCSSEAPQAPDDAHVDAHAEDAPDSVRGPHGGRMLTHDDFQLELTIYEEGAPPEFRAYALVDGEALDPRLVSLQVELERLGGTQEHFAFEPQQNYLRGLGEVREPHSFRVRVTARHANATHEWTYEAFEGRTQIASEVARASGVEVAMAGPARIQETLILHGTIVPDPQRVYRLRARYPGVVREVRTQIGERVRAGETLAIIESNESLQRYPLVAPAAGVVVTRDANPGVNAGEEPLMTLVDLSTVWVELASFQHDMGRIRPRQRVSIRDVDGHLAADGQVASIAPVGSAASQSMTVRVVLPNPDDHWRPGLFVTGEVIVAENDVPLAVRRSALQTFRDWQVVFEQHNDLYEVRPLELGRRDGEWVEVLQGLAPGTRYVTANSYLIKADIEKSGASHDH
jgi:cobalt-zinc-cadmium efflux system membrane fusion protein